MWLLSKLDGLIEQEGRVEMLAVELVGLVRENCQLMDNCIDYFFGNVRKIQQAIVERENEFDSILNIESLQKAKKKADSVDATEAKRQYNLSKIATYNLIKAVIWQCAFKLSPETARRQELVDLILLRQLMREI